METNTIAIEENIEEPKLQSSIFDGFSILVPTILIFIVFHFLLFRPQEKKKREHESMVGSVKKGEEVVTNSGIFGVITKINDSDNTAMMNIAKDIEVKILKTSIVDIVSRREKNSESKIKKDSGKKDFATKKLTKKSKKN